MHNRWITFLMHNGGRGLTMRELRRAYRVESCADPNYVDNKRRCRNQSTAPSKAKAKRAVVKVKPVPVKAVKAPAKPKAHKAPAAQKAHKAPAAQKAPAVQKAHKAPAAQKAQAPEISIERRGHRLIIECDEGNVYDALNASATLSFARAHPFINGDFKVTGRKINMSIKGHTVASGASALPWAQIMCETVSPVIKASPCRVGSTNKVFFKKANDLGDLIAQISRGGVSRGDVTSLFEHLHRILGANYYNDNRDVHVLHFKT
ncbi:hypothetical protein JKP88DRAFT_241773 [Tribonema minus]|uniref:Uncharacterized protein n=1 Tax=Tribonema minus TaxID=303371 RepID=A0A835YTJ9_9STRA|nr:hypothetical protein JKP88DRAFT_241773 [Tribonema minus]